jgi:hypothetical protein
VFPDYYFRRLYPFHPSSSACFHIFSCYVQLDIVTAGSKLVWCVGAVLLFPTRNNGFTFCPWKPGRSLVAVLSWFSVLYFIYIYRERGRGVCELSSRMQPTGLHQRTVILTLIRRPYDRTQVPALFRVVTRFLHVGKIQSFHCDKAPHHEDI